MEEIKMTGQPRKKYKSAATEKLWGVLKSSWWTSQGKITKIEQLVADGADVNDVDEDGKTLLMYACAKCCIGEVLSLLEAGASVLSKNEYGKTVLDFAECNDTSDREEIIALLYEIPELTQMKAEEKQMRREAIEKAQEEANRQFNLEMLQSNEHSVQEMLFLVLKELRTMNTMLENIAQNTSLAERHTYDLLFKYNY